MDKKEFISETETILGELSSLTKKQSDLEKQIYNLSNKLDNLRQEYAVQSARYNPGDIVHVCSKDHVERKYDIDNDCIIVSIGRCYAIEGGKTHLWYNVSQKIKSGWSAKVCHIRETDIVELISSHH